MYVMAFAYIFNTASMHASPTCPALQVEASQSMIRIVGLSATLPNYKDVALFLGVNPDAGLFYFDASYRPVPLETQFVGVSERNLLAARNIMDEVAYQKVGLQHRLQPPSIIIGLRLRGVAEVVR